MSAFQWTFAVATALALAAILEIAGNWALARVVANHVPEARRQRVARFGFFFVFAFYSVARTMTATLDARIHPLAFTFGWFSIWVLVRSLISRRTGHH